LPTPDEAMRALKLPLPPSPPAPGGGGSGRTQAVQAAPKLEAQPMPAKPAEPVLAGFEDIVALAQGERDILFMTQLETYVHLVRFEQGLVEFRPAPGAPSDLAGRLTERLGRWTGRRWAVSVVQAEGQATLAIQRREREASLKAAVAQHPSVAAVLEAFPGATITAIRDLASAAEDAAEGFIPDPDEEE